MESTDAPDLFPSALSPIGILKRALLPTVLWLVVLLLLWLVLLKESVDTQALDQLRTSARPLPMLGAFLLMFGGILFMGFRWRALLPGREGTNPLMLAAIAASGMLLNVALPGPVGEVAAAALVKRRYGIPAPVALAASVHSRFVGLGTAALLAFLIWALFPLPAPEQAAPYVAGAAIVVGLGALALALIAFKPRILEIWADLTLARISRGPWKRASRIAGRLDTMVRQFVGAMSSIGRSGGMPHLRAIVWTTCGNVTVVTGIWLATLSLGYHASLGGLLFAHCATTAGSVVLFALPIGQVGWDAAFGSLLVIAAGLPLEVALAVTVMVRVQQILVLALGALFLALFPHIKGSPSHDPGSGDSCPE